MVLLMLYVMVSTLRVSSFLFQRLALNPRILHGVQSTYVTTTKLVKALEPCKSSDIVLSSCAHDILISMRKGDTVDLSKKFRQHVNPLSSKYLLPIDLHAEQLLSHLNEPTKNPVVIDIGCAKGTWDVLMAAAHPHLNFLGLEIRIPALYHCLKQKVDTNLTNVHFLHSNANIDFGIIMEHFKLNGVRVDSINIQFPDPQFKKQLYKRRVLNPHFVLLMARHCEAGTKLFLQSDVLEVAEDMVQHISSSKYFIAQAGYDARSHRLHHNASPYPVQTEREITTITAKEPVYRMMYQRNEVPFDPSDSESIDVNSVLLSKVRKNTLI